MFSETTLAKGALLMATGVSFAQQPAASKSDVKKTAIKQTHAIDGKGNGPPAPAMKVDKYHDGVVQQRVANIVGYIETL